MGTVGNRLQNTETPEYGDSGIRRRFSWDVLRFVVVVFFLVTAYLKWRAFVDGVPSGISEVAPQLQWTLIQFEVVLAIWLTSGLASRFVWLVLLTTFAVFAGGGIYQVYLGQSSCGCFGQIAVHPMWAVSIDTVFLLLLQCIRPYDVQIDGLNGARVQNWIRLFAKPARSAILTASGLLLGIIGMILTPTLTNVMATYAPPNLTGQYLVTTPAVANIGNGNPGQWIDFSLQVKNRGEIAVRLIGSANDCQCVVGQDLPMEIPPGDTKEIHVRVKIGNTVGHRDGKIWIRTNHVHQPLLLCRWRGYVED